MKNLPITLAILASVGSIQQAAQAADADSELKYAEKVLKQELPTCADLNRARQEMENGCGRTDGALKQVFCSRLAQLKDKLCQGTKPGGLPSKDKLHLRAVEDLKTYRALEKAINATTDSCDKASTCPSLEVLQGELTRLAVHLIRNIKPFSAEAIELEQKLVAVLVPPTGKLLEILQGKQLNDAQLATIIELLRTKRVAPERVIELLAQLANPDDASKLVKLLADLCGQGKCDEATLTLSFRIAMQLGDVRNREVLSRTLELLKKRYPKLEKQVETAQLELAKAAPSEVVIAQFFAMLDPLVLQQAQLQAERTTGLYEAPLDARPVHVFVVMDESIPHEAACHPSQDYWLKLTQLLHYNYGPDSGMRRPVVLAASSEASAAQSMEAVKQVVTQVLAGRSARELPLCQMPEYKEVCKPPISGVMRLRIRREQERARVSAQCWADDATGTSRADEPMTFEGAFPLACEPGVKEQREKAAVALSQEATTVCPMFKAKDRPPCDGRGQQTKPCAPCWDDSCNAPLSGARSNAFWALASPGLPWLVDGVDSSDAVGVVASALDVALLAGAALSYNQSSSLRNQYSDQQQRSELLAESQNYRRAGHYSLIAAGALRVVGLVGYLISPPTNKTNSLQGAMSTQPLTWSF